MVMKTGDGRARSGDSLSLYARICHTRKFLPENCDVLEVGCGRGYVSEMLAKRGCNVTGFDRDRSSVRSVKARGEFTVSDFYGFSTGKRFDCILCLEVLEHLRDDRKALVMMRRWLKPEGRLVLSVPTLRLAEKHREMGHLRHYTDEKLEHLLRSCGFRVLRKEEWGSVIRRLIFSTQKHPGGKGSRRGGWLKKAIKPFMYIDTRLGLSRDGLIVECARVNPQRKEQPAGVIHGKGYSNIP